VHVAEFLGALARGPNVEVVEPFLPDVLRAMLEEIALRWVAPTALPGQYAPRKAQFERLHHHRKIFLLRFAEQQMNVLRHDHVTDHDQYVALADLFQDFQKQIAAAGSAEQRLPAIATAGDEVQVSGTVVAM